MRKKEPTLDIRAKVKGPAFDVIYKEARRTNSTYAKVLVENALKNLENNAVSEPFDFQEIVSLVDRQAEQILTIQDQVEKLTYIVESFIDLYINLTPSDSYKTDGHTLVIKDRHKQVLALVQKRINKEIPTIQNNLEGDIYE